jgi:protocatechuate 4,5-dioxygenase beta chain
MAEIVGGFLMPHDPLMYANPDAVEADQKARVFGAYNEIAEEIAELRADTAIVIGCDHYILYGPECLPQFVIGIGDLEGPIERMPGLERGVVPNNEPMARHIMETGFDQGFDWAVSKVMKLDHSVYIPYQLCIKPNAGMKTIPIFLASGVDPTIRKRRAHDLGKMIGEAVRSMPGDEKVVVIGSGGISHWVGSAPMGKVNEAFDREILALVEAGDAEALIAMDDAEIMEKAGNGALEIRNFLCAMGAVAAPGLKARTIAYEPIPAWITGLGFSALEAAA